MSERGSFTSQYIYCDDDAEIIKRVLKQRQEHDEKGPGLVYIMLDDVDYIACGFVRAMWRNGEAWTLADCVSGVKTKFDVCFIVYTDDGNVYHIEKKANGYVTIRGMKPKEEEELFANKNYYDHENGQEDDDKNE